MSDYISKQALLAKLHEIGGCDAEPNTWARGYDDAIDEVYKMVEALPVDTSPCAGSEYIDKAVAVNILNAKADMGVCSGAEKHFAAAAKMIELLPAVDVAPVRHGRWEYCPDSEEWANAYLCSICEGHALTDGDYRHELTDYCPHCGAKMDGGADFCSYGERKEIVNDR